ncbi:MAG: penicillin-binding protein 2 [Candidatus Omnitrophica bacterium]|nr:penicillin-binding protein 2 [Candidatus Omnitrophota bacterium]
MRLKIIRIIITVLFIGVILHLFNAQVIRGKYYHQLSTQNRIRVVPLDGWRGAIRDRNGVVLADNKLAYNLAVTPQDITDVEPLFEFLEQVLDIPSRELMRRYQQNREAPFAPVVLAEDITREKAIVIEENEYRFPSIWVQKTFRRFYPLKNNSAHVLGYVDKVNEDKFENLQEYGYSPQSLVGYLGVEEYYDRYLRGEEGGLQVEVNNRGKQVRLLSIKDAKQGQDIELTIDSSIQGMGAELLQGRVGSVVMMDMESGEILAMVSSPDYDPNVFVNPAFNKIKVDILTDTRGPLINRVVRGTYPPGSVFKIPMAFASLDSKKVSLLTRFNCPGYLEVGGRKFGCTHVHGEQDLMEAIAHSCDVYFYHVGQLLGADMIAYYGKMFGLGRLTGIDLPYEKPGFIPERKMYRLSGKEWYLGNTLNFSIGQGDTLATSLQLARMLSTVALNGAEVQPHVIRSINGSPVSKFNFTRKIKLNPELFTEIKKGLRATVADPTGTAYDLNMPDLYIAGKTGTAQTMRGRESHAWFAGYALGKSRHVSFCVFLEYGGSSQNACILGRQLFERMREKGLI